MNWWDDYFWVLILVFIGLGFLFPAVGLFFKPAIIYLLMGLMVISSININIKEIWEDLRDLREELFILTLIFIVTPLLVFVTKYFLDPELFLGFIIIAAVPCGISVVFLSDLYRGKPAQALTITGLAHLLSPVITPLLVFVFASKTIQIDFFGMVALIVKLIIIPLILAQFLRKYKTTKQFCKNYGKQINSILLFIIIWAVTSPTRTFVINQPKTTLIVLLICIVVISLIFGMGYLFGKKREYKITFGISASYKNFTLATVIALTLFGDYVALPSIMWTVANNGLLAPIHLFLVKKKKWF